MEKLIPLSDSSPPIRKMTREEWIAFVEKEYNYWKENREKDKNKDYLQLVWIYRVTEEKNGMLKIETDMRVSLEGQPEFDCPIRIIYPCVLS